jgi:hypothetical protein
MMRPIVAWAGHDVRLYRAARAFEIMPSKEGDAKMRATMNVSTPDDPLSTSRSVQLSSGDCPWRFENLWMVGVLFVFSMCATYVFITMTGPARMPAGLAALVAPFVSHRVLSRQR